MLLQLPALWRRRPDNDQRALPELHLPQPNADVLLARLPLHQAHRPGLRRGEARRPMLPHSHMPRRYLSILCNSCVSFDCYWFLFIAISMRSNFRSGKLPRLVCFRYTYRSTSIEIAPIFAVGCQTTASIAIYAYRVNCMTRKENSIGVRVR